MADDLLIERRDGVLYLTMNRPARLNALSGEIVEGLLEQLPRAVRDREIGCVVLTGAGRGFCSGGDLRAIRDQRIGEAAEARPPTLEESVARLRRHEEASALLYELPKVTIAAVNGPVAGAGLSLALACDIRIASDAARFTTAFARVGFSGDFGGSYLLTQLVGRAKARELYLTADIIGAEEALKFGIVNRVVPAASFKDEVHAFAKKIAAGPLVTYAYMKANLNQALASDLRTMLDREALAMFLTSRTEDHREAIKAFLEKRQPKFQGR